MKLSADEIVNSVSDKWLPLVEAVDKATGRRPHLSTCLRWCTRGSRGVRLESRVLGGRRLTTVSKVLAYMDATTAASVGGMVESIKTPHQQNADAQKIAKKLAKRLGAAS